MSKNKPAFKTKRTWKKTPTMFQMEVTECGAASLGMILGYYGCFIGLEQLRIDCGVSRDGCNAKNMKEAAVRYGLEVQVFMKEVEGLLHLPVPSIIHWNLNHFVVFEGVKNGKPYINDPADGRRALDWDELFECFTGIVMTFEKSEDFQSARKESSILKYAIKRTVTERKTLVALLCVGLLLVVPGVAIPLFTQFFVDYILAGNNPQWTSYLIFVMAFTIMFQAFFTVLEYKLQLRLQIKMALVSGNKLVRRIMSLPTSFFAQRFSGDITYRVEDNNTANNFMTGRLTEAVLNMMVAMFFLIVLLFYSPLLTIIGLCCCSISVLVSRIFAEKLDSITKKQYMDSGKQIGALYSGLNISDSLKASGCENEFVGRLLGYCAKSIWSKQKANRMNMVLQSLPLAISKLTDVVVLVVGGELVINGSISAGMLVGFAGLLTSFTLPVNNLVSFLQEIQSTKANINRVEDIENYETIKYADTDNTNGIPQGKLSGKIEVKDVSFGYSKYAPAVVENVNIDLPPGKMVALVGASASGKSTVGKLISGLIEPWQGEINFDGIQRLKIKPEVFHSSVATVSQEINLFSGSIRDNITLWNPYIMDIDLDNACKDACIYDTIIKLPEAYDYVLNENGTNLSGGQRQRLEIAAALVTNPTILVLDEATAALDAVTEKKIMENIRRRNCSCVIIAHRLSTIRNADEILYIDHGQIIERGTHEELCDKGGLYAKLIENA